MSRATELCCSDAERCSNMCTMLAGMAEQPLLVLLQLCKNWPQDQVAKRPRVGRWVNGSVPAGKAAIVQRYTPQHTHAPWSERSGCTRGRCTKAEATMQTCLERKYGGRRGDYTGTVSVGVRARYEGYVWGMCDAGKM